MLNKWTILLAIKEARDRRIKLINKRMLEIYKEGVTRIFFTKTPFLSRLREYVKS